MNDRLNLPEGFVFMHKILMNKPAALLMREGHTGEMDGVKAAATGNTFDEAEQECLRRFYAYKERRE